MKRKTNRRKPKANQRKQPPAIRVATWRPTLVLGVIAVGFIALVGRAVQLQMLDNATIDAHAANQHYLDVTLSAHRGPILDRNNVPLAVSIPVDSIWVNPREFREAMDRVDELGKAIERDQNEILRRISQHMHRRVVFLRRHMQPDAADAVMALDLPGVYTQREYRRFYPHGEVTGHVLGFTDVDDSGQEGLELAFDGWLKGKPGERRMMRDRLGRIISDVEGIRPAHHGKPLVTSLDSRIQHIAYRELKRAVAAHDAKSGSIVVIDVHSGELLAMANQPSYNPNDRSQLTVARYRNRAATDIFEPGSSMKPFIVAAAMETGIYSPDSVIDTSPGSFTVGRKRIEDIRNFGPLTLGQILQKSSNVGISKVALELPPDRLWQTLAQLGFGSLTTSGFPGESAGLLNSHQHWREIGQATLAYGYGLSVTPLQLAQGYATIASGGMRYPVTFVKRDAPPPSERVLRQSTADNLVNMLESVIRPEGTGSRAKVVGYRVAGKTGTARKYEASGYSELRHVAAFAGLAPATAPEIAVVVVIDEPGGDEHYGGQVAAPVFAEVMSGAMRVMAVPPDQPATMSADQAIARRGGPALSSVEDGS